MKKTNLDKKYHGGRDNILGNDYETNFFVQKVVEAHISDDSSKEFINKLKRGKRDTDVDDVCVETNLGNKSYYQCRRYARYNKELYEPFLNEFLANNNIRLALITQDKYRPLAELVLLANNNNLKEFQRVLFKDTQLNKEKKIYQILISLIPGKNGDREILIYNFLKHFNVFAYDEIWSTELIKDKLKIRYEPDDTDRIYDKLYSKANRPDWLDKEISKDEIEKEINKLNLQPIRTIKQDTKLETKKTSKKVGPHLLISKDVRFNEKLKYIFKLIINSDISEVETKQSLSFIQNDSRLAWHFLKNLDKPEWFLKIKDSVIKSAVELEEDSAVKFQLLSYFEQCVDKYSDEIVPLAVQLERNTQDYNILSNLVKTLGKLKPRHDKNIKLLWNLFSKLTEHQHPWVRREIPKSLTSFVNYDTDKVLEILDKVFSYNPPPPRCYSR